MPLRRPSLRSKSRSPIPPAKYESNTASTPRQTPDFLPPSHYAAAANLHYQESRRVVYDEPTDFPTSNPSSWSTMEHTGNVSAKDSVETESRTAHSSRNTPQAQMGIPTLESNLLPSLRDTINKMTRPPSRGSAAVPGSSHVNSPNLPLPSVSQRSASAMDFYTSSSPSDAIPVHYTPKTPKHSAKTAEKTTPHHMASLPKSVLKSALRSPMAKSSPVQNAAALPNHFAQRSSNTNTRPSRNLPQDELMNETRFGYRNRSCTDPGAPLPEKSSASSSLATPQISKAPGSALPSSLPRFHKTMDKPRRHMDQTELPYHDLYASTDESDLEYRYELASRDKRRLIVANVENLAVSSSSDSEADGRRSRVPVSSNRGRQGASQTPPSTLSPRRKSRHRPAVGLGLAFPERNQRSSSVPRQGVKDQCMSPQGRRSQQDHHPEKQRSDPVEESKRPSRRNDDDSHQQRREALLNLVSGLGLQHGDLTSSSDRAPSDSEPQCLAISGSGDMPYVGTAQSSDSQHGLSVQLTPKAAASDLRRLIDQKHSAPTLRSPAPQLTGTPKSHLARSQSRSPVVKNVTNASEFTSKRMSAFYVSTPKALHDTFPPSTQASHDRTGSEEAASSDNASSPESVYEAPKDVALSSEQIRQSHSTGEVSNADSDLSTLDHCQPWNDGDYNELSTGAESLFRQISRPDGSKKNAGQYSASSNIPRPRFPAKPEPRNTRVSSPPSPPSPPVKLHYSQSEASIYEDETHDVPDAQKSDSYASKSESTETLSWASDIPLEVREVLVRRHGQQEISRQQIIYEICETEKEYTTLLRCVMSLFISPLRLKDSRTWIAGVPLELAKLLDWLDDIVHLHAQLNDTIQRSRTAQYPIVERFAENVKPFVHRLEVYQPYVVRLGNLKEVIDRQVKEGNDLAEFIKMQEELPECRGWTFVELLEKPVSRLAQYPSLFEKLLEVTPLTHSDYISTLSLRYSTDLMIRVMTEVKIREDEYELAKGINKRVKGLPQGFDLASRDRRLLHEGPLALMPCSSDTQGYSSVTKSSTLTPRWEPAQRNSRLVEAINGWDNSRRARSDSTTSSATGYSVDSCSSASSAFPLTPVMDQYPPSVDIHSANRLTPNMRNPRLKSPLSDSWDSQDMESIQTQKNPGSRSELAHVFLFTDLIICSREGTTNLGRVINVCEIPKSSNDGKAFHHLLIHRIDPSTAGVSIRVDLISLDAASFKVPSQDPQDSTSSVTTLLFSMPDQNADHCAWLSALQKCQQFTIRALSIPPPFGFLKVPHRHDPPSLEVESNIRALLASGLPHPKSPSIQLTSSERGNAVSREREERGWWSLRFKQVLQEVQNGVDPYLSIT
ncbi:hypothetical protein ONZ45_g5983 [Pleurotus djamor]|nr:hypothetical protein ONZ45_g5983 [Pleurotus djamor]